MRPSGSKLDCGVGLMLLACTLAPVFAWGADDDRDGLPDSLDACPEVQYHPRFSASWCAPLDGNPGNDPQPQCKARERVVQTLLSSGVFCTHIAFAVVIDGTLNFADAFSYVGSGNYELDPDGIHRLYRIGSTSKSVTAVASKILEEHGGLSFGDYVNANDGTRLVTGGQVTLRNLLTHRGAFTTDYGAIHLFCHPGDLAAFWQEPDDLVSPHYDSPVYGNLGGGYSYSAFNYSLAGTYLASRTGESFADILQTRVFDPAGMCTASLDGARATQSPIGTDPGVSQTAVMDVGPYINLTSRTDARCEDNFYSSEDLPGDPYSWEVFHIDEAGAQARDPAGGVIASVIDLGHFAESLLASYHGTGGLVSAAGIRDLWAATTDLGCGGGCPYERYYGTGFFTANPGQPVTQVGHGGSRAGYASGFVLRPEANLAAVVLANADVSTVTLSNLCKTLLNDIQGAATAVPAATTSASPPALSTAPNPMPLTATAWTRCSLSREGSIKLEVFDVRGRMVSTIRNGAAGAGRHAIAWRPVDAGLAPGTYFLRLAAPNGVSFQKIVVLP